MVHPLPPSQLTERLENTGAVRRGEVNKSRHEYGTHLQCGDEREQETEYHSRDFRIRCHGGGGLPQRCIPEGEDQAQQLKKVRPRLAEILREDARDK